MVGLVHATKPIDAIQRFMSRIDLGVIPHVVDTVIFIQGGGPKKVFAVDIQVKVPSGMTEEDLARPIVCISDFETDKLEYEVYTFGEQTMVIPVTEQAEKKAGILKLAGGAIKEYFYQYADKPVVEMLSAHKAVVYVPAGRIAGIIGQGGKNIQAIEKELGISIDLRESSGKDSRDRDDDRHSHKKDKGKDKRGWKGKDEGRAAAAFEDSEEDLDTLEDGELGETEDGDYDSSDSEESLIPYDIEIGKREVTLELGRKYAGMTVILSEGRRAITTTTVSRKGHVVLDKNTAEAVAVAYAVKHGELSVRIA
jgi:predicted PilT family ATPase